MKKFLLVLLMLGMAGNAFANWDSSTDMQILSVSAAVTQVQNSLKAIDGTSGTQPDKLVTGSGGLVLEGATANDYETTITATDPTADRTITLPNETAAVMVSSLTTNATDVANSVTGASNGLVFEGATANDYETTITATDPTADRTQTVQNNSGVLPLGTAGNTLFLTTTGATDVTLPTSGTIVAYTDTRFKVGSFTRDTATATGTQSVTGVGFSPKTLIFLALQISSKEVSWGVDSLSAVGVIDIEHTTFEYATDVYSIIDSEASSTRYLGKIQSLDSDGFTIAWTKEGSPTGTLTVYYLALR